MSSTATFGVAVTVIGKGNPTCEKDQQYIINANAFSITVGVFDSKMERAEYAAKKAAKRKANEIKKGIKCPDECPYVVIKRDELVNSQQLYEIGNSGHATATWIIEAGCAKEKPDTAKEGGKTGTGKKQEHQRADRKQKKKKTGKPGTKAR